VTNDTSQWLTGGRAWAGDEKTDFKARWGGEDKVLVEKKKVRCGCVGETGSVKEVVGESWRRKMYYRTDCEWPAIEMERGQRSRGNKVFCGFCVERMG
jgi:hypothetical protein